MSGLAQEVHEINQHAARIRAIRLEFREDNSVESCEFCGSEAPCHKCDHDEERGEIEAQEYDYEARA